jgi:cytochrome c553
MAPVAAALTPAQRADVAAYYSSLTRLPAQSTTEPDGKLLARGAQLAREGDEPRQIQACARCHGADGTGVQLAGPYLAGQSAAYVTGALEEWKDNRRAGRKGAMAIEAERLTEEDIAAVAAYFSSRTVPASSALAVSPETLAP